MNKSKFIKLLVKNPISFLLNGFYFQQELDFKRSLISKYQIDKLPTVDLLEFFPDFEEDLIAYSFLEGTSLITDIMLLKKFARSYTNCNYLEIGSWRGESLVNVSEVAAHCTSITLSGEELRKMGLGDEFIKVHGIFSKNSKNISEILHNSRTFDFNSLNQKFDLIFIDGDHSYEGVLNDTKKSFDLRRDSNSMIVWHDYGFSTETVRHSVLKAILDGIPKELHNNLYHISNSMCAVYAENKHFSSYYTKFPTFPNKKFSIQLKTSKM